jgi:hypothetical protein
MLPEIKPVTDLDIAFGNIKDMPEWEDIPKEYDSRDNPWAKVASDVFFNGTPAKGTFLQTREGVDPVLLRRKIQSWMVSFAPKHERKIAACAWLLAENCTIEYEEKKDEVKET